MISKILRIIRILAPAAGIFGFAYAAQAATLRLSPASKSATIGEVFSVDVLLDTHGQAIDGVDLKFLNYNPYYLELQDADSAAAGVQIGQGSLMPNTLTNTADTVNGKVNFSQLTNSGAHYTGSGVLATLTFKALVAGSAKVDIDYTAGQTTDSNVASNGTDILSSVAGSTFTISYPTVAPGGVGGAGGTNPASGPGGTNSTPAVPGVNPNTPAASLKLVNSNGTYYLIIDGVRHGITNPGILFSYGFAFGQAKTATAADAALPEGSLLLPGDGVLAKTAADKTVWLISGSQKHGFTSAAVFTALGFKFTQVLVVTAPELNRQPVGANIDNGASAHLPGMDINDSGTVYWIGYGGERHAYPSLAVYNSWRVPNDFSRVLPANAADRAMPVGTAVEARLLQ